MPKKTQNHGVKITQHTVNNRSFQNLLCPLLNKPQKPIGINVGGHSGVVTGTVLTDFQDSSHLLLALVLRKEVYDAHEVSGMSSVNDMKRVFAVQKQPPIGRIFLPGGAR